MHKHLAIFDTTLRDGLQTPGLPPITRDARVEIALMLERMGVDVIEAGFPISSEENFKSVEAVAKAVSKSTVCALAMATEESVECAARALAWAPRARVHIFLGSSTTHLSRMHLNQAEMLERTQRIIRHAVVRCGFGEIEFSPEDAGRTDFDFLCRVVEAAISAGARIINIPDTVGYCMPHEYGERIRSIIDRFPNFDVVWSVHCHDDFGCATANSLMGVIAGARQVECTMYNIGERAGNAALEEIVMAVRRRQDVFSCDTRIDATMFWEAARLVENITKVSIPRNKAVVGENAFAHESGIHQDGVLKNPTTYEVMRPDEVGWQGRSLPLGPQSGRHALAERLKKLKIELNTNAFTEMFARFKTYADEHGQVSDEALYMLSEHLRTSNIA